MVKTLSTYAPYIVSALILIILGYQFYMWFMTKRMRGTPLPEIDDIPGMTEKSKKRSLLYFYTQNCTFCRSMTPIIKDLQRDHSNVFLLDAAENTAISKRFSIKGVPAIILISDHRIDDVLIGLQKYKILEHFLNE